MCDQVVTLFRFARSERYLPKDRTTEAEDVAEMKVARQTVDMFTPEELRIIIREYPAGLAPVCPHQRLRWSAHFRGAADGRAHSGRKLDAQRVLDIENHHNFASKKRLS